MKTFAKIFTMILAVGAVCQAVSAYSTQSEDQNAPLTPAQCEDMKSKLEIYFASENYATTYSAIATDPKAKKNVDKLLHDLKAVVVEKRDVEPGP